MKDALFELLNYNSAKSRSMTSSAEAITGKRKEITIVQLRHSQKWRGGEELNVVLWRTCRDTMYLRIQEDRSVDDTKGIFRWI